MIEDGSNNANQEQQQLDNLNRVVSYCYNTYDCRRQQMIRYFHEEFSQKHCHETCDNCRRDTGELEENDFTEGAPDLFHFGAAGLQIQCSVLVEQGACVT